MCEQLPDSQSSRTAPQGSSEKVGHVMDVSKVNPTGHGLSFGTAQPSVLWRTRWSKHWIGQGEADLGALWHLSYWFGILSPEARRSSSPAEMLIFKGSPPLYQQPRLVGPVLNQGLGMERHKEEALTSGWCPELMKNAMFPTLCTDSGPGEQQEVWNDRGVCSLQPPVGRDWTGQSGHLSHVDSVSSPRKAARAGELFPCN